ncbi:TPA: hypothetical protein QIS87_001597 [Enterobacter bugandensis]|nr:hypothetical protein [Enterobacter bugandensis]
MGKSQLKTDILFILLQDWRLEWDLTGKKIRQIILENACAVGFMEIKRRERQKVDQMVKIYIQFT